MLVSVNLHVQSDEALTVKANFFGSHPSETPTLSIRAGNYNGVNIFCRDAAQLQDLVKQINQAVDSLLNPVTMEYTGYLDKGA